MFQCKICGKEFPTKEQLGGHISGHSRLGKTRKKNTEDKGICKNCDKPLTRRDRKFCSIDCSREYKKNHSFYKNMDITVSELDKYRETQTVCEICGRPETMMISGRKCNLAVDHDHKTNRFRGLLCYSCNTKLSWYENWKHNIESYLSKNADKIQ